MKKKMFKRIYVEITNKCNLKCSFCIQNSRPIRELELNEFEEICKNICDYTSHIYLFVLGEPLCHSNLTDLIKIANNYNLKVNITTNGFLIKQNEFLSRCEIRKISFSLHSYFANKAIVSLEDYLQNILNFCKLAIKNNILCELRFWNKNSSEEQKNIKIATILHNFMQKNEICDDFLTKFNEQQDFKITKNFYVGFNEEFVWPSNAISKNEQKFCHGGIDQLAILCDGTIVPCCLDARGEIALGNIFTDGITRVLQSKRYTDLINGFKNRKCVEALCKKCSFSEKF